MVRRSLQIVNGVFAFKLLHVRLSTLKMVLLLQISQVAILWAALTISPAVDTKQVLV